MEEFTQILEQLKFTNKLMDFVTREQYGRVLFMWQQVYAIPPGVANDVAGCSQLLGYNEHSVIDGQFLPVLHARAYGIERVLVTVVDNMVKLACKREQGNTEVV